MSGSVEILSQDDTEKDNRLIKRIQRRLRRNKITANFKEHKEHLYCLLCGLITQVDVYDQEKRKPVRWLIRSEPLSHISFNM